MFRLRRGAVAPPCSSAVRLGVAGLAVLLTGCASKQSSYQQAHVAGPPPSQVTRVEIEDDGLPAQLALRYRQPERDDPTEPWSPNYGKGERTPSPAVTPADALNQARRREMVRAQPASQPTQLTGVDEDALVRRAIAEHEMRRRD